MKKQEIRWYLLWLCAAGMLALTFVLNTMGARGFSPSAVWQLIAALLLLAAGIITRRRWRKKHEDRAD